MSAHPANGGGASDVDPRSRRRSVGEVSVVAEHVASPAAPSGRTIRRFDARRRRPGRRARRSSGETRTGSARHAGSRASARCRAGTGTSVLRAPEPAARPGRRGRWGPPTTRIRAVVPMTRNVRSVHAEVGRVTVVHRPMWSRREPPASGSTRRPRHNWCDVTRRRRMTTRSSGSHSFSSWSALGLWRRSLLITEQAQARAATARAHAGLVLTRQKIARTIAAAEVIEADTRTDRGEADGLGTIAEELTGEIRAVEQQRDDAALSASYSGAQIGPLRECLAGVNRALNQISVGDTRSVDTLATFVGPAPRSARDHAPCHGGWRLGCVLVLGTLSWHVNGASDARREAVERRERMQQSIAPDPRERSTRRTNARRAIVRRRRGPRPSCEGARQTVDLRQIAARRHPRPAHQDASVSETRRTASSSRSASASRVPGRP